MLKKFIFLIVIAVAVLNESCALKTIGDKENNNPNDQPPVILWAWERPEDLRFLDAKKYGVAFLAETLELENDEVKFNPRRQPLKVSPNTYLIAVTRIETNKTNHPSLSDSQLNESILKVKNTLSLPNVKAVQIDFDALVSERDFYKSLIHKLKNELPPNVSLSMTALASWCASDNWLSDLPIDEAVPMAFQMGADDQTIRQFLAAGKDWNESLCRKSYGIGLNEPLKISFQPNRKFFLFNSRAWKAEDLSHLPEGVKP